MIISRVVVPSTQIKLVAVDPSECKNPEDFIAEISGRFAVFLNFYRGRRFNVALGANLSGEGCLFLCLYPKTLRFFRTSRYMLPVVPEFAPDSSSFGCDTLASVDGRNLGRIIYRRMSNLFPFLEVVDFFPIKKRHFYRFSRSLSYMQKVRRSCLEKNHQAKRILSGLILSNQILSFIMQRCRLKNFEFFATERATLTHGDLKELIAQTAGGWTTLGQALENCLIACTSEPHSKKRGSCTDTKSESALHLIQLL